MNSCHLALISSFAICPSDLPSRRIEQHRMMKYVPANLLEEPDEKTDEAAERFRAEVKILA